LNVENKFIGKALLRLMIFFEKYSYQSSLKNFLTNAFVYLHTLYAILRIYPHRTLLN